MLQVRRLSPLSPSEDPAFPVPLVTSHVASPDSRRSLSPLFRTRHCCHCIGQGQDHALARCRRRFEYRTCRAPEHRFVTTPENDRLTCAHPPPHTANRAVRYSVHRDAGLVHWQADEPALRPLRIRRALPVWYVRLPYRCVPVACVDCRSSPRRQLHSARRQEVSVLHVQGGVVRRATRSSRSAPSPSRHRMADACVRSNWLEGMVLMCLYVIIAVVFWYYPGKCGPALFQTRSHLPSCIRCPRTPAGPFILMHVPCLLSLCLPSRTRVHPLGSALVPWSLSSYLDLL